MSHATDLGTASGECCCPEASAGLRCLRVSTNRSGNGVHCDGVEFIGDEDDELRGAMNPIYDRGEQTLGCFRAHIGQSLLQTGQRAREPDEAARRQRRWETRREQRHARVAPNGAGSGHLASEQVRGQQTLEHITGNCRRPRPGCRYPSVGSIRRSRCCGACLRGRTPRLDVRPAGHTYSIRSEFGVLAAPDCWSSNSERSTVQWLPRVNLVASMSPTGHA